ncbi:succinylglutamate desuccinylase [Vibrio sp. SCSIO 43136]|uniref:succinylglutamate desuccinylase n=1 Tax=Vibrio sp. SCSIO 43136 TaxID=2819101 RepID=UPI002075C16E|nr:succinylglutamate desuccinylase [Vibrio sp. SCSIO 43136]USD63983.1 succinylglutamate desuccinylase [Vibrio sp. SCSIO 43136]
MASSMFQDSFLQTTLDDKTPTQLQVTTPNQGQLNWLSRGVVEFIPKQPLAASKDIVVSSGIHGDETLGIEMVDSLVSRLLSGEIDIAHRCLFIIGHPQATLNHTRFLDENMNRLFASLPSHHNTETKIAVRLMEEVERFFTQGSAHSRWHLDLHSAIRESAHFTFAVSPYCQSPVRSKALFEFLEHAQVEAVMLSGSATSTFSWFGAERFGAQALTLELGRVAKLGDNDHGKVAAFESALDALLEGEAYSTTPQPVCVYRVTRTITKTDASFSFTFADSVANFTRFDKGELLAIDGESLVYAQHQNEAVVFPNSKVALNQRAALMVVESNYRFVGEQLVID